MRSKLVGFALIALIVAMGALALGCTDSEGEKAREAAVEFRNDNFERAVAAVPAPMSVNFPVRQALADFSERQDRANHPYYVYVIASTGNVVEYYTSKTVPVNICAFLSSTEDVQHSGNGNLILTAPSLDGIFYGGAGASAACNGLIVFDAVTDAMHIIYPGDQAVNVSDAPRDLDLDPIRFLPSEE